MIFLQNTNIRLTKSWLILSISSLALAGLFSILLVSARSPIIQNLLPWHNVFKTSLTIHVNLSVVVWFLAVSATMWSLMIDKKVRIFHFAILCLAIFSVILMILAPFISGGRALLNNYVPILDNKIFITAIISFLFAIFLFALLFIFFVDDQYKNNFFYQISYYAAWIYILSFFALLIAFFHLQNITEALSLHDFYELLFWGAGHLQQVFYTQIMLIAWLYLAQNFCLVNQQNKKLYLTIFLFNLIIAIITFLIGCSYDITDYKYIIFFTQMMRDFGGISPFLLAVIMSIMFYKNYNDFKNWSYKWLLLWSIFMFAAGGLIGFIISGSNTIIPAHYHGSIVAVTIALMGFIYNIMPKLGYNYANNKLLFWQVWLYGMGQLMHITGFALSGGYGALRKTPAVMDSLLGQIYMGLMGLGGLLSVLGGLLFVLICIKMFVTSKNS